MGHPAVAVGRTLGEAGLAALEVFEEAVDLVFAFESDQAVFQGFGVEEDLGGVEGFSVLDAGAEAIERGCGLMGRGEGASGVDFADGAGVAVAGDEHLGGGTGFFELLLKASEGGAQGFGFGGLVFELLRETLRQGLMADAALEGGAGEIVLLLLDGEFGFAVELVHGFLVLLEFLLEEMLVGDGDGDLRFDLEELVLHVEDELLGEFLGVFGLFDEVVDVGSQESSYAFE
jgi:hypothetical protein